MRDEFNDKDAFKTVHGERAMLNLPGFNSTAAIVAEIEDTKKFVLKDGATWIDEPYPIVQISDCDRKVSLDFDFTGKADFVNNLHKVDTMIEVLKKFRRGLVIEQDRYEKRRKIVDERNREKKEN